MASDSSGDEDEDDEDDDDGFSRNLPRGDYQTVSAQITTIKYAGGENRTSPRNILAPDLGSSLGTSQLKKNAKFINLGMVEPQAEEDIEAQRGRKINLSEL